MMKRVLQLRNRFTGSPEEAVLVGKIAVHPHYGATRSDRVGLQIAIRVVSHRLLCTRVEDYAGRSCVKANW